MAPRVVNPSSSLILSSLFPGSNPHFARTLHIHHKNQERSRLLQLPPEIRTIIWQHLLSSIQIHLLWQTNKGLKRCPCCPTSPTSCPYISSPVASNFDGHTAQQHRLGFSILRTSRQIRTEVSSLLLSNVTFAIDSPYAFYAFFKHLSPKQRGEIGSLKLACAPRDIDVGPWSPTRLYWNRVLHSDVISQLTGLRKLSVLILCRGSEYYVYDRETKIMHAKISRGFLRFRRLERLGEVEVKMRRLVNMIDSVWDPRRLHDCSAGEDLVGKIKGEKLLVAAEVKEVERFKAAVGQGQDGLKGARKKREPWKF